MIDAIISKLGTEVPALTGRVQGALEFGATLGAGKVPGTTPAAFVIPGGILGARVQVVTGGVFVQNTEDVIQIILALRAHDVTGERALDPLRALIDDVFNCLCGWRPSETAPGVLTLQRAATVSLTAGLALYQIDLSLSNQLRISR